MVYRTATSSQTLAATNAFLAGVYRWMTAGLLLTAAVAWGVATSPAVARVLFGSPLVFWGLILAELGLVMAISGAVHRMSAGTATGLFLLYSALNGATLSAILLAYSGAAVFKAFLVTAGTFGVMSIWGATTSRDLSGMGSFLFMGLVGIILTSVVNIFLASPAVDFVVSAVGVLVFTGLTAYDTQTIRQMGETAPMDDALAIRRGTILGALRLYLDFINLFLMLLRFFGGSRD